MAEAQPRMIHLRDYKPSDYAALSVALDFDLHNTATRVKATTQVERHADTPPGAPLHLHGEHMKLRSVRINDEPVSDFVINDTGLEIPNPPKADTFTLEIENEIDPEANTALTGLYRSNNFFVTQCEPEGFRRITYSFDRPDVLAIFKTRIEADKTQNPVLLSNGNCVASGDLPGGRHFAEWEDPHPKPTYLFALVAGALGVLEDSFTTMSGRDVALRIYAEPGKEARCAFAMESLKKAMKWDEETFGLEYDLDIFMIVTISSFNGGAMENKGLNVFADRYILADPETATDTDYEAIESVVAHEYFHNWTGNRITCRDWFQLCLKEGLTVFRDQLFSSDMRSEPVKRIQDVQTLRRAQFAEDAGPLSHPVRPDHFIEIDNFFTSTVYEKGAEICRMISQVLGREGFRKGMDLYRERHDGEAATVEQFVSAMGNANGQDLSDFLTWYSQSGTPEIRSRTSWDKATGILELTVSQMTNPTPDQVEKRPLRIPMALGLVAEDGQDLVLRLEGEDASSGTTRILELDEGEKSFRFTGVDAPVTPSLFRGFSAPVRIMDDVSDDKRIRQMSSDSDPFNRWEAARGYSHSLIKAMTLEIVAGQTPQVPSKFVEAMGAIVGDDSLDPAFKALMLALPTEREVALDMDIIHVRPIHEARDLLRTETARALKGDFGKIYHSLRANVPFSPDAASAGRRALGNAALSWLAATKEAEQQALAVTQYQMSDNMTDTIAALQLISHFEATDREACLGSFYERWKDESTIVDKWLQIEAVSSSGDALGRVRDLTNHEAFSLKVPNRVRSLLSAFAYGNPLHFNDTSGQGWRFIADQVLALDKVNPAGAASLCEAFSSWRKFDAASQELMKREIERIAGTVPLSRNLFEIATRLIGVL